jgi:hypothetical protein
LKNFRPIAWTLFAVVIALLIIKNPIAKQKFEGAISRITASPISMQFFSLSFEGGDIEITNLNLLNERQVVFPIQKVYLDFDRLSIFTKQPRFEQVRVYVGDVVIVRNEDRSINLSKFAPLVPQMDTPQFHIDDLRVQLASVTFKDYTKINRTTGEPSSKKIKVDYKASFKNVTSAKALMSIILFETLKQSGLHKTLNIDLKPLEQGMKNIIVEPVKEI